jgi:hypothetical protein
MTAPAPERAGRFHGHDLARYGGLVTTEPPERVGTAGRGRQVRCLGSDASRETGGEEPMLNPWSL